MRQSAISFDSKRASLDGVLTTPQELPPPYPTVVVCHAHPTLGGDMDSPLITAICRAADAKGFATLRFNFRGVGSSGGEFTNGDREHEDVKAALNVMKRWPDMDGKRLALVAYSFSAGVALRGLKQTRAAGSLVLIAPPISSLQGSRAKRDKRPKLYIVGQNDKISPTAELQRVLDEMADPVNFAEIPDADHGLIGHEGQVADRVADFLAESLN
ncbi:MAG: alpha/beta hydrolase [Chloroflexi bacterium]|nr:alpha/beta hydrolase [Chloroflexota bacterium]